MLIARPDRDQAPQQACSGTINGEKPIAGDRDRKAPRDDSPAPIRS